MAATLKELVEVFGGRIIGNPDQLIEAAMPILEAGPGTITFLDDLRYKEVLMQSPASAVLVTPAFADPIPEGRPESLTLVCVEDPRDAFMQLVELLSEKNERRESIIDPRAIIDPTAKIGADVAIGPFAIISEDVEIGDGVTIGPGVFIGPRSSVGNVVTLHHNVVIYEKVQLGDRVTIFANAVIGADGFGYKTVGEIHEKIPQRGQVVIESDVEIGALSSVDRGTFGPTRIGAGTKIDNLVQVGHNAQIGKNNLLCALTGIGGSVKTGESVFLGGQAGVRDHMTIGARTQVGAQSGVNRKLGAGEQVWGTPAIPVRKELQTHSLKLKLPEMKRQLIELTAQVQQLSTMIEQSTSKESAASHHSAA